MFIPTRLLYQQLLVDALSTVTAGDFSGVLVGCKIGLFLNVAFTPTEDTVIGDLNVPTYPGYALQLAVFGTPYHRQLGGFATNSARLIFKMNDATVPTLVYGYFVVDGATPAKLLGVEVLAAPLALNSADDAAVIVGEIAAGGPDWGTGASEN